MPTLQGNGIGKVTGLWGGTAMVRGADGKIRKLALGDEVRAGDVIMTTQDGIVQITSVEGEVRLANTQELLTPTPAASAAALAQTPLAAPAAGPDGLDLNALDPTAAGLAGGEAGDLSPGLRVDRISEGVGAASLVAPGEVTPQSFDEPEENATETGFRADDGGDDGDGGGAVNTAPTAVGDSAGGPEDVPVRGNLLDNDSDADGDPLTVTGFTVGGDAYAAGSVASLAGVGTLVINADGSYVFRPAANYDGPVPVATYTVSDGQATASATLTITLDPVSDAPTARDDTLVVDEDSGATNGNVLDNDTDLEGDVLEVTGFNFGGVDHAAGEQGFIDGVGWLEIRGDGSYTFSPFPDYTGPVPSASYTISDGTATATATLTITIEMISDDAPTAVDDALTTNEDTPLTIAGATLTANDLDPDGDRLTIISVQDAVNGTVALIDGNVVFTPAADFNGTASFSYTVVDPAGLSSTASVSVAVLPLGDAPLAAPDVAAVAEDGGSATGNVLDNDTDADGDALTVTQFVIGGVTYPAGSTATLANVGSLVINADGSYAFTPVSDYNGDVPTATYTISDGTSTSSATLSVSIGAANDAPLAAADTATIGEDGVATGNVLANDADVDGDALTVTQFVVGGTTYPAGSTALVPGVGSLQINADGLYTFTPLPDYNGSMPSATYTVSDGTATSIATLDVAVTPANDAPLAVDDALVFAEDATATGNVLGNDTDADGDALSVTQFSVNGGVYTAGTSALIAGVGSLVIDADGSYSFTPLADYDGPVPPASYTVSDGTATAIATLALGITPTNDAPDALGDTRTIREDSGPATGNVLTNDSDAEGDPLTVTQFVVDGATYAAGTTAVMAGIGSLVINPDGAYTFTPQADFNGSVPDAIYTVSDGSASSTATLALVVSADNDGPVANPDVGSVAEDGVTFGNVLGNDVDADGDALTVTQFAVSGVTYAASTLALIVGIGELQINPNGNYVFKPLPDYDGPIPEVTYTITDGAATSSSTLQITVNGANDAPRANDDPRSVGEDAGTTTGNVLGNDGDVDGDALTVTRFEVGGTVYPSGTTATLAGVGTLVINADGSYAFTPLPDYAGDVPGATYTVSDGQTASTATLDIAVAPINDAPAPEADTGAVAEDGGSATGNVLDNDADADGDTLAVTQYVVGGTTYAAGTTATLASVGSLVVNADGSYVFTPLADYNGSAPTVTYTVSDGSSSASATLDIGVAAVNDAPAAAADSAAIDEDGAAASGNVLTNDFDLDGDTLGVTQYLVDGVLHAAGDAAVITGVGTLVIRADGSYSFTPVADYNGAVPTATYTVSDGSATATSTLDIAVAATNDAPSALADTDTLTEDAGSASGNVLVNDSDTEGQPLTVTQFVVAGNVYTAGSTATIADVGSLVINADGGYTFTPLPDFNGAMPSATYTVSDGSATTTATLDVAVDAANDAPVAADDSATIDEDAGAATGNVLSNDADVDGDTLGVTGFSVNGNQYAAGTTATLVGVGSLVITANGAYSFTPEADYTGSMPTATYTVSDGTATSTATLDVTVSGVNDAPLAAPDQQVVDEDTTASGNVLANDGDADGDTLVVDRFEIGGTSYAAGATAVIAGVGSLTLGADGAYSFAPAADFSGPVPTLTYFVTDGQATSGSTLDLEVGGVNDAPVALADAQTVAEDSGATGNVLDNDRDPDGDALFVTQFTIAGQGYQAGETAVIGGVGQLTLNADGSYAFAPLPNFNGSVPPVSYVVSDGTASAGSTLTLDVNAVNDPPDAVDDGSLVLDGLAGEYFAFAENVDGPSLVNLAQVTAWLGARTPDASFSAQNLSYGEVTGDLGADGRLQAFLGSDAASLSGDPRNTSDAIIRLTGQVTLAAGTYNVRVLADDGYQIRIDGRVVGEYADNQGPTTRTHASFVVPTGGTHSIEIIYWDQGGQAVFRPEISSNGGASYVGLGSLLPIHSEFSTREDTALTLTPARLLGNDSDADGDALTITSVQGATNGTVALVGGNVVFTPAANYHGLASFTYTIADGNGGLDTATVTLQVAPMNDAPTPLPDAPPAVAEDSGTVSGNVLGNDSDVDGDALGVTQFVVAGSTYAAGSTATIANVGSLVIGANGAYTFTSVANYNGTVPTATYTVSDGASSATSTLVLNVTAVNDAPVNALPANQVGIEDIALRLSGLSLADVDAGTGTMSVTLAVGTGTLAAAAAGGVGVTGNGTGSLTLSGTLADLNAYLGDAARQPVYSPLANASGAVALTMTSSDGSRTDIDASTITLAAVADAPTLAAPTRTVAVVSGFEEGSADASALGSGAWRTHDSGGTVEINAEAVYQGNGRSNRVIELERNVNDAGDLYTDVATRAGEVYRLDLSYMARSGALDNSVINVIWDGQVIGRLDSASATLANYRYTIIATTTGTSRLTFVAEDSNSVGGLLDNVSLTLKEHSGMQGYLVNLPAIAAALVDTDGSESLRLTVGAIPSGMFLSDGSGGHASAVGTASVDVTGWNLDELAIVPQAGYASGDFNLSVTATSTEASNGSAASTAVTVPITVLSDVNNVVGGDTSNDTLTGTGSDDMMWGLGGNDTLNGANGRDTLLGDDGNDRLNGGNGADRLSGGRGNDTLVGNQDGDFLHGGAGNDTLTGHNAGSTPGSTPAVTDVFAWHLGDAGSAGAPASDVITDFKLGPTSSGGDVLDLRDLLQGESGASLGNYLHFSYDSGSGTTISISTTGGFEGGFSAARTDQQITLTGVDLTTAGNDAQIIADLLSKKQLIADSF